MTPEEATAKLDNLPLLTIDDCDAIADLIARLAHERCPDDVRAAMRHIVDNLFAPIGRPLDNLTIVRAWLDRTEPRETKGHPE
jgi:hypothetical protein